jgi:hypothetical protein
MASRPLPRPVTASDQYLAALLDEVRGLRADLAAERAAHQELQAQFVPGVVELREPASRPCTPIPEDLPGGLALVKAGIICMEDVPYAMADLVAIPGIGPATARAIRQTMESG